MNFLSRSPSVLIPCALLMGTASAGLAQQPQDAPPPEADLSATYTAPAPEPAAPEMTEGPEIEGIISAHKDDMVQVTGADGTKTLVTVNDATRIKSSGGFLGLNHDKLTAAALLNGLPVTIKTLQSGQSGGDLVASQIDLKKKDLKVASMIRNGTEQGFAEQTAATEALRGHVADIDQYNVKSTTDVNFAIGKAALSPQAKSDLCAAATTAEGMPNALLLVVGYTDSTGSTEFNQVLSERRAASVVNYLQQACHWKPYRMLTPTGMSEADPMVSNDTTEGRAQNRRVAVNILVSKGLDGM